MAGMVRSLQVGLLLLAMVLPRAMAEAPGEKLVIVTSNGWHSGIVIARADLPPGLIPETADFPAALYFEFGWGAREYYPAPRKTLGMTIDAIFPGPAVVHMAGLPRHPAELFPGSEWIALRISGAAFGRLVAYLDQSFERSGAARAQRNAPGLFAYSAFYPATGRFHLYNTCNTWTARGLASAGLPVRAAGVQRAEDLMAQLRGLARDATAAPVR